MDALTESRETNRRLNRRLGSMENHLHSMLSHAQRAVTDAQERARAAQSSTDYWVRRGSEDTSKIADLKDRNVGLRFAIFLVSIWAVVATAAVLWLSVR